MAKNIKELKLSKETEKLNKETKELQQKLAEAEKSIDKIKTGDIDALVITDKKELKIYTDKTADKTYRILIEKMHEGVVTLNKDGTILYCNSYFANMVNLPMQKVIGVHFNNFLEEAAKEHFEALYKKGWEKDIKEEIYINANDGKVIPMLISFTALPLDNNNFGLSIILRDLSLQKKNEEELKNKTKELEEKNKELANANTELASQIAEKEKRAEELVIANKDLTTFTYVASHDLQEPLRKIKNFSSILLEEEVNKLSDKGKIYLQKTHETANRMQTLIEDLLTYTNAKGAEQKFEKTSLNLIVDEVKKNLEETIQKQKATIETSPLCEANIIRYQFRQLLQNLISNSLKFSKPEQPAYIVIKSEIVQGSVLNRKELSSKIDYCHITYIDNGIGFDPQYKDRIFEVFQRLHSKEEYEGTGIGLAICKRIVENHKGIITATSELNKGAQFDIYIPVNSKNN